MASDEEITRQLLALLRAKTGDPTARVSPLVTLPGHAGQSYSFDLEIGANAKRERLVLRLAPEGVRPVGTADVVRQARIMKSLEGTAVPVPRVRWLDDDPAAFGRGYFIVDFVQADKLAMESASIQPTSSSVSRGRSSRPSRRCIRCRGNRCGQYGASRDR